MKQIVKIAAAVLAASLLLPACHKKIKQQEDEIYSRHLQEHVKLTIISTPMPDDKNNVNLLLLNDGQDLDQFRVKATIDSMIKKKLLDPMVVVGINTADRMQEYGVAGFPDFQNRGSRAEKYDAFISNELLDFIKKKAGIKKFGTVVFAGCSLGGLSAFDISWNHADKIDKVGVFSGSFWWRDKDAADPTYSDANDRIILNKIRASRKRPKLKYWFYAGAKEEDGDRDKDGIIDVIDDTRDLIALIKSKNVCPPQDIVYEESPTGKHEYTDWNKALPDFLSWAFGR